MSDSLPDLLASYDELSSVMGADDRQSSEIPISVAKRFSDCGRKAIRLAIIRKESETEKPKC
jgi:hypothetical protein